MVAPSVEVGDDVFAQLGRGDPGDDPQPHEARAYLEHVVPQLRGCRPSDRYQAHQGLAESVFEGDAVRDLLDDVGVTAVGGEMVGIDGHVLAVGIIGEIAGDPVADLEALYQPADLHHRARRLVPGPSREGIGLLQLFTVGVFVGGHVARADSAGFDLDQHLIVGDPRRRDLPYLVPTGRHHKRCSHLSCSPSSA